MPAHAPFRPMCVCVCMSLQNIHVQYATVATTAAATAAGACFFVDFLLLCRTRMHAIL